MMPQFKNLTEFMAMGGHGGFVFGAWGLSIGVILVLIGRAIITGRRQKARLAALDHDRPS